MAMRVCSGVYLYFMCAYANAQNGNMRNPKLGVSIAENKEGRNKKSSDAAAEHIRRLFLLHTMELINGIESDKFHSRLVLPAAGSNYKKSFSPSLRLAPF